MTDWNALTARAGRSGHDLVGWIMWDPAGIARYEALGVPNGAGWLVAWRLAPLGGIAPAAAAAATYSITPDVVAMIMGLAADAAGSADAAGAEAAGPEAICAVRDESVIAGLDDVAPGLADRLAPLAEDLWRGADSVHLGARPMFAAHRAEPRPESRPAALSAWLGANCLRELRGDNHWALCAAADLDDVEVGLLHSVMVDHDYYGGEEWIARSRGNDDAAIARGWARLESKGLATDHAINDAGRDFRLDLEERTDELTAPAWQAVGEEATVAFCEAIEPHHDAFVARIDATAGQRWMPAVRQQRP
ncbi:MAG: SCO6745 family protein [Microthrixaceae bacterium]